MNTDRFLTRVFDKQKKRMLYPQAKLTPKSSIYIDGAYKHLIGISAQGVIAAYYYGITYCIGYYPFGDRFIPMQCLGKHDKNKKLIYADDIVATSNNKYLVYWDEESAAFWFERLDNECEILIDDFGCEIEIIGNKWEHPALLEESRC